MKKVIIILLVVAVIAVIAYMMTGRKDNQANPESARQDTKNDLAKPAEKERVIQETPKQSLEAFPKGFPIEAGAEAGKAFKYIPAQSLEQQSTVTYASNLSLDENKKIFADYIAESGFKVINTVDEANMAFFYATKDNNDLSVQIKDENGTITVSATYLKR